MELRIRCRLEKEEEEKHHVSKVLAPQIAQLALNSKSLLDELMHGENQFLIENQAPTYQQGSHAY